MGQTFFKLREEYKTQEWLDKLSKAGAKFSRQMRNYETVTIQKWDFSGCIRDLKIIANLGGLIEYSDTADLEHFYGTREQWDWDQKRWAAEIERMYW